MTETAPFATSSGTYLSTLTGLWLPRHWWKVAVPLIAIAGAGMLLHDERLILVALMLLFIVVPMGMSFLYTYYMLTPEARRAVLRKKVVINPGHFLRLIYLAEESPGAAEGEDADLDEKENPRLRLPADEDIPWSHIRRVKKTGEGCVYILDTPRLQFVLVPWTALPQGAETE